MKQVWLVCYDVRDNHRRRKLAKVMERRCQRVQYSVFECPVDERTLTHLFEQEWTPLLKVNEDSLRAYPVRQANLPKIKIWGSDQVYEPPDYLIY